MFISNGITMLMAGRLIAGVINEIFLEKPYFFQIVRCRWSFNGNSNLFGGSKSNFYQRENSYLQCFVYYFRVT